MLRSSPRCCSPLRNIPQMTMDLFLFTLSFSFIDQRQDLTIYMSNIAGGCVIKGRNLLSFVSLVFCAVLCFCFALFVFVLCLVCTMFSMFSLSLNRIDGVMASVLASSVVDRGFDPWSGQTKDYKIGICCFSAKHAVFRRKNTDWLARNQDNVSKWSDMSTRGLLLH
jgi:cytochrome b subunit of formate dehydrogenase